MQKEMAWMNSHLSNVGLNFLGLVWWPHSDNGPAGANSCENTTEE